MCRAFEPRAKLPSIKTLENVCGLTITNQNFTIKIDVQTNSNILKPFTEIETFEFENAVTKQN